MVKRVVLVSMHRFPFGDAASNRLWALAKSIVLGGYEAYVVGNGVLEHNTVVKENGWHGGDGLWFTSIRAARDTWLSRVVKRLFSAFYYHSALKKIIGDDVACVITTHAGISLPLILMCRFFWKKPLVVDCTEWHEFSQFYGGRASPGYLNFAYRFNILCPMADAAICITKLLGSRFSDLGVKNVVIPPQVSVDEFPEHELSPEGGCVELFYAGSVTGKDDLKTVLAGLLLLSDAELSRIRFTIAGPSESEVFSLVKSVDPSFKRLQESLRILGRVSRGDVLKELRTKHFTVLMRPVSRYSMAGFPSKIPESLAAGVPVIGNVTSDLGDYLCDGSNSLLVRDQSPIALSQTFQRAISLNAHQLDKMSDAASDLASSKFDYKVWAERVGSFIRAVS